MARKETRAGSAQGPQPVPVRARASGFPDIQFGLSAAEDEKTDAPNLLLEGFLDEGYVKQLLNRERHLVIGPKGSGKSALSSRIELLAQEQQYFSRTYYLKDFPYSSFSGLLPKGEAPELQYPLNWEYVLLVALVGSFAADNTAEATGRIELYEIERALQSLGLLPKTSLADIVKTATRKEFRVGLGLLQGAFERSDEKKPPDVNTLFETLQETVYSLQSDRMHYIVIDGLDDALTARRQQYEALEALIVATDRINRRLKECEVPAHIIVLCRADVLDQKLHGPNKNKIRQDRAVTLEWYEDTRDPKRSRLIELINHRAKTSLKREVDVFAEYFPHTVNDREDTIKTLIDLTRHRPRDIIHLLKYIQDSTRGAKPQPREILNGIRRYSEGYLIPEIRDELFGFLTEKEIESAIDLLMTLQRKKFTLKEAEDKARSDPRFQGVELRRILDALFECSAIGNVSDLGMARDVRFAFKYRNRYAKFDPNADIIVHYGLHRGLNLM